MNYDWDQIKNRLASLKDLSSVGFADIIGNVITAVFWFYIAALSIPEKYGEIFYFISVAGTASAISLVGTSNTLSVYTAKDVRIQSTLYFISIQIGIVSSLLIGILFKRLDVILVLMGFIFFNLASGKLLGKKLYRSYAKYVLLQKILTVVLGLGFYSTNGIESILYALALSYFVFVKIIYDEFRNVKINFSLLKTNSTFIINNYILSLSGIGQLDKLIIGPLLGYVVLGQYSLATQFIVVFMSFSFIIFKYILPHDASGNSNVKLKKITTIVSVIICGAGVLLLPFVIPVLFPRYIEAIFPMQIMSLFVIPSTITLLYSSKFLGLEKNKILLTERILEISVLISGIIVLGSLFGTLGLSITLVMATSVGAFFFILVDKRLPKLT